MNISEAIFREAFSKPRDPRSNEYKEGVLNALRFKLDMTDSIPHPYKPGTAQADAYYSGCNEGHHLAREYIEQIIKNH